MGSMEGSKLKGFVLNQIAKCVSIMYKRKWKINNNNIDNPSINEWNKENICKKILIHIEKLLSSNDPNRELSLKLNQIEIKDDDKKTKKYIPLSKRQDKPDSALWLIKQHSNLKDSQIAKLVGITKNSATAIRNKSYWNFNNLSAKDPVAMGLFTQKDLIDAIEKAERRIKREKKEKEKLEVSK